MSGFVFKADTSVAEKVGQGGMRTGVYKVTVKAVCLSADRKGNPRATFIFENSAGKRAIVFDMMINEKWTTGADNVDYAKWQEFVAITGMTTGATKEAKVKMSDKKEPETKVVFTEPIGKVVNIALQEIFEVDDKNEERINKVIYRTFTEDGKSLVERNTKAEAKTMAAVEKNLAPYETKQYVAARDNGSLKKKSGSTTASADATVDSSVEDDDDIL